jgi:hypothetical protein
MPAAPPRKKSENGPGKNIGAGVCVDASDAEISYTFSLNSRFLPRCELQGILAYESSGVNLFSENPAPKIRVSLMEPCE